MFPAEDKFSQAAPLVTLQVIHVSQRQVRASNITLRQDLHNRGVDGVGIRILRYESFDRSDVWPVERAVLQTFGAQSIQLVVIKPQLMEGRQRVGGSGVNDGFGIGRTGVLGVRLILDRII